MFIGVQLFVCIQYLHVGLAQVWSKVRGPHVSEGSSATGVAESGQTTEGFPMPSLREILSGTFQREFENAARDNFPSSKATLMPLYRDASAKLSTLSLAPMPAIPKTSTPLLRGYALMQIGDGEQRICDQPTCYLQADRGKLADHASYYNDLRAAHPAVRLCVFPALKAADWCAVGGLYGPDARKYLAGDRYVREFRALLDRSIAYAWAAEGCSFQDAISCYYKTDHHWSFPGAYRIYCQLWRLLHQQNPQMSQPPEPRRWIEVPGVTAYGSAALRAGCYDAFGDAIVDGDFDLPDLKIHLYGFEARERNAKRQYLAGQYEKAKFTNRYGAYFGGDYGLIEYTSGDVRAGNLLVISDSFDNCIEPLLASHFHYTWFADMRLYTRDVGEPFDIDDFIRRHGITDVLFLGGQAWVLGLRPLEPYAVR